jgi:alginate export protein
MDKATRTHRHETRLRSRIGAVGACAMFIDIAAAAPEPCAPQVFRWADDCHDLAARSESVAGLQRLRYVPLTSSDAAWLTLGGEYRFKAESLSKPSFGIRGVKRYTANGERFLADADLRGEAGPRLFVQFSAATDAGRKPGERLFDRSRPDLAQAFVDIPISRETAYLLIRIGRQELDLDGNRLVAVREAANLRRAFDMALARVDAGAFSSEIFGGHPVLNKEGAFDDRATPGENFWGARLRETFGRYSGAPAAEVFFFGRRRDRAVYQDAVGPELRRLLGARFNGRTSGWDYATQASIQRGVVAGTDIRAYGFAADLGYSLQARWKLRAGVSLGVASGDSASGDGRIGTSDVLYPNLGYFTDAPLTYPGNDWDIQPNVTLRPNTQLTVQSGVDLLGRLSSHDAIYEAPGIPLVRGTGGDSHFITALSFVKVAWRPLTYWELTVSYVHASVGSLLRHQGGRDADYGAFELSFRL